MIDEAISKLIAERDIYKLALEKIADPRKRDHSEPDAYTQLGCVMNLAQEAIDLGMKVMPWTGPSHGYSPELHGKNSLNGTSKD